jgi:DNA-binding HxlR family transcriptional regulator
VTDLQPLIALVHHRWTLPILAELHRTSGSKFVTLLNRLGIPRDSLQATLTHLIDRGLVRRNEGYGHPLRPEYLSGPKGKVMGEAALRLVESLARRGLTDVALRKWSLPTLVALGDGELRFGEIRSLLPGVTPRALTLALKELAEAELIAREVVDSYPPTAVYRLTRKGREVGAAAQALVRVE